MNFILASSNQHKVDELNKFFSGTELDVELPEERIEVVEDGTSFEENALKKAKAYYDRYQRPSVSDDSGICVEALPEELGIYSARFGGPGLTDKERVELLVEKLKESENRNAYFVCYLCFYISPEEVYFFEGRLNGEIADGPRGEDGFGYDPVFLPEKNNKKTLAEDPQWKAENSHRSLASSAAREYFINKLTK